MTDLVGTTIENTYRIERLLGEGGMGAVYQAREISLDRPVAIKVMHPHIARQPGFAERFLQEARAIAKLDHPNIVRVLSFSRSAELLYIAMRFVEGQNLRDWLHLGRQRNVQLAIPETLAIGEVLAGALDYAHRRGVYHRDIKPGNIILEPLDPGQVTAQGLPYAPVITDFGLAKLAESGVQSITGQSVGTPAYMAPEQCLGQDVDGRTDIYALGIVLYEMLTGQQPYAVSGLMEALRAHTEEPPPPPRTLRPSITGDMEAVVLKALAKDPAQRYQSGAAFATALRSLRTSREPAPPPDATLAAAPEAEEPTPVPEGTLGAGDDLSIATMIGTQRPEPTPAKDAWPTPPSEIPVHGRILALGPGGTTVALALKPGAQLIIGRDADADMTLPDRGASRRHAQVVLRQDYVELTDLGSTNGTYLGERRLLPGIPERWEPHEQVRIGEHWIRLEMPHAAAGPPQPTPPPPEAIATPTPVQGARSVSTETTYLAVDPAELVARAGRTTEVVIRVMNRQPTLEQFAIQIEGLPAAWIAGLGAPVDLPPGDMKALTLRITPPPDASPTARPLRVVAVPRMNASARAEVDARARIEPARAVEIAVQAPRGGRGRGQIHLVNHASEAQSVTLSAQAPQNALQVTLGTSQVQLGSHQEVTVPVDVEPLAGRPLLGAKRQIPFAVRATTAEGDVSQVKSVAVQRPLLPLGVALLVAFAAVAAVAAMVVWYLNQRGPVAVEPTPTATVERVAEATQPVDSGATATAIWLDADPDEDGLSNREELVWGTDPERRDTDNDGLLDGEEVEAGLSPINSDTDGDGLRDDVDPEPLQPATPTDEPTVEPTAVPPTETIPPPTATAAPTWTPCPLAIDPTLAPLWDRGQHGCAVAPAQLGLWAFQPMQGGVMFWSELRDSVIMIANNGRWVEVPDNWDESKPELSCSASPPEGLIQPKRGFGMAWCSQPDMREALGFATLVESVTDAVLQTTEAGQLLYQIGDAAWVLHPDGTWTGQPAP
jgi:eukaryotic-like serine/threonine-protein kinase